MMKKSKNIFLAALATPVLLITTASMACNHLAVQLSTEYGQTCKLLQKNIIHGRVINNGTHIPTTLSFVISSFEMDAAYFHGPEVSLTYQCSQSKPITITMKQKYCVGRAGKITASSSSAAAVPFVTEGSVLYGTHGNVAWQFSA